MALIPTDVGINLRTQVDSPLRGTTPISEIPSDLPELKQGQVFSARIVEVLPEATYRALVAGKSITLSLPGGAKAGDSLELVVVDKTPRLVMARLADSAANLTGQAGEAYPHATFSPTAQLIGKLLPSDGEAAKPLMLNHGEPLLATTPAVGDETIASQLGPQLEKAVAQSGMFYESHQAKWVAGELPTQALLEEPQNQLQRNPTEAAPSETQGKSLLQMLFGKDSGSETIPGTKQLPPPALPAQGEPAVHSLLTPSATAADGTAAANTTTSGAHNAGNPSSPANSPSLQSLPGQVVPDELRHLVQQQLDAAATQRMVWHGEVWPHQPMDWEIQRDGQRQQGGNEADQDKWTTRLALTTPRLGRVEATLELSGKGVAISMRVPEGQSLADLQQGIPQLSQALEAAGVPAQSIRVWQHAPAPASSDE